MFLQKKLKIFRVASKRAGNLTDPFFLYATLAPLHHIPLSWTRPIDIAIATIATAHCCKAPRDWKSSVEKLTSNHIPQHVWAEGPWIQGFFESASSFLNLSLIALIIESWSSRFILFLSWRKKQSHILTLSCRMQHRHWLQWLQFIPLPHGSDGLHGARGWTASTI